MTRKLDRICLRCGHSGSIHDEVGGICQGTVSTFTFTPQGFVPSDQVWMCGCRGFIHQSEFGVRTVMDIHDRVWNQLMGYGSPEPGEEGRPYWRPSSLGYCLRRQYLFRAGIAETRVESEADEADKQRRFAWGRDLEDHIKERMFRAGLLIADGTTLEDPDLECKGHMDFMWGGIVAAELPERAKWWSPQYRWAVLTVREKVDEVLEEPIPVTGTELKTTHSHAIRKMFEEGPRFDYRCQAGAYWLMAQRHPEQLPAPMERFEIVVVGRDAVHPLRFEASQHDAELALKRLEQLNEAWHRKEPPACTCGQADGMAWETKYCPYPNEDGDGCCGSTLLDLLQASVEATRR